MMDLLHRKNKTLKGYPKKKNLASVEEMGKENRQEASFEEEQNMNVIMD